MRRGRTSCFRRPVADRRSSISITLVRSAYFAPDAAAFSEAGELKDDDIAAAQRILDDRGMAGETGGADFQSSSSQGPAACPFRRQEVLGTLGENPGALQRFCGDGFAGFSSKTPILPPLRAAQRFCDSACHEGFGGHSPADEHPFARPAREPRASHSRASFSVSTLRVMQYNCDYQADRMCPKTLI